VEIPGGAGHGERRQEESEDGGAAHEPDILPKPGQGFPYMRSGIP